MGKQITINQNAYVQLLDHIPTKYSSVKETYTLSLMNVRREEIETDSVYFTTLSSNLLFKRGGRNSRTHLQCKRSQY